MKNKWLWTLSYYMFLNFLWTYVQGTPGKLTQEQVLEELGVKIETKGKKNQQQNCCSLVQGLPLQNFVLKKIDRKTKSQVLGTASSFLFAPLKKTSVSCSDVSILCCLVFSFLVMVVSMKLLFLAPSCLLRQNRRRKKFLSKLWCLTKKNGHSCCCHPQIQFTYLTSFSLYSI